MGEVYNPDSKCGVHIPEELRMVLLKEGYMDSGKLYVENPNGKIKKMEVGKTSPDLVGDDTEANRYNHAVLSKDAIEELGLEKTEDGLEIGDFEGGWGPIRIHSDDYAQEKLANFDDYNHAVLKELANFRKNPDQYSAEDVKDLQRAYQNVAPRVDDFIDEYGGFEGADYDALTKDASRRLETVEDVRNDLYRGMMNDLEKKNHNAVASAQWNREEYEERKEEMVETLNKVEAMFKEPRTANDRAVLERARSRAGD